MRKWTLAIGLIFVTVSVAHAASATDMALYGKDPEHDRAFACYERHYDPAHLKTHPQQNVTDMTVLVDRGMDEETPYYNLSIGVNFRKLAKQFEVSGSCSGTIDGQYLLSCGVECDGGSIDVRVKDRSTILLDISNGARTWDPTASEDADENDVPPGAQFGEDDKTFFLSRTDLRKCADLVWDADDRKLLTDAAP